MAEDPQPAPGAVPAPPEDDAVLEALGFALWNEGRTEEAIALLEQQIARAKDKPALHISAAPPVPGAEGDGYTLTVPPPIPVSSLPRASFEEHFDPASGITPAIAATPSGDAPASQSQADPASNEALPPPHASAADEALPPPPAILTGEVPSASLPPRRRRRFAPLAAVFLLVFVAVALWVGWGLHRIDLDEPPNPRPSVFLEAADGTPLRQTGGSYAGPVLREELPDHLVHAVLATEDRRFYEHFGFDIFGIVRAAWRNLRAGGIVEGGSTITQQLAKVLFLTPEQTLRRKLQEALIATWLDFRLSKDEILVKYLDSIYFGAGATGITAAAEIYFGKPVRELDLAESAMLAGLIRSPSRLNPLSDPEAARERATVVMNAMVEAGFLSRSEALAAVLIPAAPVRSVAAAETGSWYGDWVLASATGAMGPLAGAARIRTTLQPRLQAIAENVVRGALEASAGADRGPEAALVAMSPDGAVTAMVGGRSYDESQFNRAVDTLREPGAAFSVAVYLAALRLGWTPDDTVSAAPAARAVGPPPAPAGDVTLAEAFTRGIEGATARLAEDVGIQNVIKAARDLGIDAELKPGPAMALGRADVSLLDLTGAYAAIAAGQIPLQPWAVKRVSEDAGAELSMRAGGSQQTRELGHSEEIRELLAATLREELGWPAGADEPAYGKGGVSAERRDGWFLGYADGLVAGVWVGNDDDSPLDAEIAARLPAQIWKDFMARATGLAPAEREPSPAPQTRDVPVADGVEEPEERPAEAVAEVEEQGSAEPAVAAVETDAEGAETGPAAQAAQRPPSTQAQIARVPAPAPARARPSSPPEPEIERRAAEPRPEPRRAPEADIARRAAAPQPQVVRRPANPEPQVARPAPRAEPERDPGRRLVRTPPAAAPGSEGEGPAILLGGRRAPELGAPRRREPERRVALEGPRILLGGQGAASIEPQVPVRQSRGGGPMILLGGRGLP